MIKSDILMLFFLPIISFVITISMLRVLIPLLRNHKMGQKILEIGPSWHKNKEGTATMGGISFIFAVSVILLTFCFYGLRVGIDSGAIFIAFLYCLLSALIGMTDDLKKISENQNEGLKPSQKYALQLMASGILIAFAVRSSYVDTVITFPFLNFSIDFKWFYYIFALIFMTGFNNAVNLTDGVDGLCTAVTAAVSLFFFAYGLKTSNDSLVLLSISVFGGCIGFLIYNFYPAKIFMGDTGSLFLGAAVTSMAFLSGIPLILLVVGIVYVIETLSVILQVVYFKISRKRLFLMAPFHHHLEKKGWSERKITVTAFLFTVIISALTYFMI